MKRRRRERESTKQPDVTTDAGTASHAELERRHNAAEHRGREYDSAAGEGSLEPLPDYDLDVMPRGV